MSAYNDDDDGKLTLSHVSVADVVDCLELFFSIERAPQKQRHSILQYSIFSKCYWLNDALCSVLMSLAFCLQNPSFVSRICGVQETPL